MARRKKPRPSCEVESQPRRHRLKGAAAPSGKTEPPKVTESSQLPIFSPPADAEQAHLADAAGPALIDAIADFVERWRAAGHAPEGMREAALTTFAHASGGAYAVAVRRADRREVRRG